jgi:hypothetical protein
MSKVHVEVSDIIDAAPQAVYEVLTDYRVGHPAILPKPYFAEITVDEGGQGAGTIFRLTMKVMGRETNYRMVVTEPQPGRVLVEADEKAGVVTTFTVEPVGSGQSRLTIATDSPTSAGFAGFVEKLLTPLVTRRIYRQEIRKLAAYVQGKDTH